MVSYQTAYLKANYPLEYMTACLNINASDVSTENNKLASTITETRDMGIALEYPKYGESEYDFKIHNGKILFGLRGIKSMGEQLAQELLKNKFNSFQEVVLNLDHSVVRSNAIQAGIYSGYFDDFGTRKSLIEILPSFLQMKKADAEIEKAGLKSLFDTFVINEVTNISEYPLLKKLEYERAFIQSNLDKHPVQVVRKSLEKDVRGITISELLNNQEEYSNEEKVKICVIMEKTRKMNTKKGDEMAISLVSDETGDADLVFFPKKYQELKKLINVSSQKIMVVSGKVQVNTLENGDQRVSVLVDDMNFIKEDDSVLYINKKAFSDTIHNLIQSNNGPTPVVIIDDINLEVYTLGLSVDAEKIIPNISPNLYVYKK